MPPFSAGRDLPRRIGHQAGQSGSIVTRERCSRDAVSWATAPLSLPGIASAIGWVWTITRAAGGSGARREQAANRTPARSTPARAAQRSHRLPLLRWRRLRPLTGFAPPDRMRGLWSSRPPLYCARRRRAKSSTRGPVCWINTIPIQIGRGYEEHPWPQGWDDERIHRRRPVRAGHGDRSRSLHGRGASDEREAWLRSRRARLSVP